MPGALPAKRRRGAIPAGLPELWAGAGLARVWASECLRNLFRARAPALSQRRCGRRSLCGRWSVCTGQLEAGRGGCIVVLRRVHTAWWLPVDTQLAQRLPCLHPCNKNKSIFFSSVVFLTRSLDTIAFCNRNKVKFQTQKHTAVSL